MAHHGGGAHGGDPWLPVLTRLIANEPEPATLAVAIAPLADVGVDVVAAQDAVDLYLSLAQADWHPDDWRHTHPGLPKKYAGVAYLYTCQDPNIYAALGAAMHGANRAAGPGGISAQMRACLPVIKLLDVALIETAIVWGFFTGETLRGVKHAFPQPTVADHDPKRHFMPDGVGRELHFFEFNSSSTNPQVMYRQWFCGRRGPRTLFTIQSVEGVSVKKFSAVPDEEEVLFRPLARFKVTGCTKLLTAGDLRDNIHPNNGFPDAVQLQQLPTFDEMAALQAKAEQLRGAVQARVAAEQALAMAELQQRAVLLRLLRKPLAPGWRATFRWTKHHIPESVGELWTMNEVARVKQPSGEKLPIEVLSSHEVKVLPYNQVYVLDEATGRVRVYPADGPRGGEAWKWWRAWDGPGCRVRLLRPACLGHPRGVPAA
eukprot:COSAG01_NODE_13105_length_1634_cov_69.150489_1_plen_429_part_01